MTKPRGIIALFLTKPRGIIALFLTKPRGICAFPTAHTNAGNPTSILLFLRYESQRPGVYQRAITVVICFDFIIFAL